MRKRWTGGVVFFAVWWLGVCLSAFGCRARAPRQDGNGGDAGFDAATDAVATSDGGRDGGPDAERPMPEMPEAVCQTAEATACDDPEGAALETWAAAEYFGDVRFVAQDRGDVILAEKSWGEITYPLVLIWSEQYQQDWGWASFEGDTYPDSITPVDVTIHWRAELEPDGRLMCPAGRAWCVYVLACDASNCRLFGIPRGEPPWLFAVEEIQGGTVPLQGEVHGLSDVWTAQGGFDVVCVFGDGLSCFDGRDWTTLLPAGTGPLINDMAHVPTSDATPVSVAVGDEGRLLVVRDATAVERDIGSGDDLLSVTGFHWGYFVAAGRNGLVVIGTVDDSDTYHLTSRTFVGAGPNAYYYFAEESHLKAVASGGCILHVQLSGPEAYAPTSHCFHRPAVSGAPLPGMETAVWRPPWSCPGAFGALYFTFLTEQYLVALLDWCEYETPIPPPPGVASR